MTEEIDTQTPTTPWHLWAVGVVSLLWNAMGAFDYVMTKTNNADYLAAFTAEQIAYFNSFPFMANVGWGLGVWGSVIGSILLLLRLRYARQAFVFSLVGLVITATYNFVLSNGMEMMGAGGLAFTLVIAVVAVALLVYSNAMAQKGVLR